MHIVHLELHKDPVVEDIPDRFAFNSLWCNTGRFYPAGDL